MQIDKYANKQIPNFQSRLRVGFTLVELLVSIGILAVIFTISSIALSTVIPNTSQSTTYDTLINDLRSQQTQAMTNDAYYGIHFESNSYTLFRGASYNSSDASNFVITLDPTVSFANVTFSGSEVVFTPGSGDVADYIQGSDGFTLKNSSTGNTTAVKINIHGATY